MDNINVVYLDMPTNVKSYVINKNDYFTVILNSRLSQEQNEISYIHELEHIKNGDYAKKCRADLIEIMAHE
jgi:hypothetical protein